MCLFSQQILHIGILLLCEQRLDTQMIIDVGLGGGDMALDDFFWELNHCDH